MHNARDHSEHKSGISVNVLERLGCTLVQNTFGNEAFVLIELVGGHAGSERSDISDAELSENSLSGGVLILSWETDKKH